MTFPRIQGGDIGGEIVEAGPGVDRGRTGQQVIIDRAIYRDEAPGGPQVGLLGIEVDGGFADFVTVAADHAHDVTDFPLTDPPTGTSARGALGIAVT